MNWSTSKSREMYRIEQWGSGYFDISKQGNIIARPNGRESAGIALSDIIQTAAKDNITLPAIVRFNGILQHRIQNLDHAFKVAMARLHYHADYCALYPIKVNQQRTVLDAVLTTPGVRVGLEAGSKAELLAALAYAHDGGMIVCNGYKDRNFIRTALTGEKLGHTVFIVIEKEFEVDLVIEEARRLGVTPHLGLRTRLSAHPSTRWADTGGDRAKFGLSAPQLLRVIEKIRSAGFLSSIQLLHFHMGSQVSNLCDYRQAYLEAIRHYEALHALGCPINTVDVGGGIGVDYDGTHSKNINSTNFGMEDYATTIIGLMKELCDTHALPYPRIFTETGRALTAHHAVLLFDVVATEECLATTVKDQHLSDNPELAWLQHAAQHPNQAYPSLSFQLATQYFQTISDGFIAGQINLTEKALSEQYYADICMHLNESMAGATNLEEDCKVALSDKLASKYICNFSLFQSLADSWAIDQVFPIMPIARLTEKPDRNVVLQDLTCDSDGKVREYVSQHGIHGSLPLHEVNDSEPYVLAVFLVGAYQETLGSKHNLFGKTNCIDACLNSDGSMGLSYSPQAESAADVLEQVGFDITDLVQRFQHKLTQNVGTAPQPRDILALIHGELAASSYFKKDCSDIISPFWQKFYEDTTPHLIAKKQNQDWTTAHFEANHIKAEVP